MSDADLSGNWRVKAYNMHEQTTPKVNPFHGVKLNVEGAKLVNPFEGEPDLENMIYPSTMETSIRPEDVPTVQPTLPLGDDFWTKDLQEPSSGKTFPTGAEFMQAIHDAMVRMGMGMGTMESIVEGLNELPDPKPYEIEISMVLEQAFQMFLEKNEQYGNAIEYTGVMGSVVAMTGDIARLRVMTLQRYEEPDLPEMLNIRDKLLDILVQAAIGILMLDKDNLKGI